MRITPRTSVSIHRDTLKLLREEGRFGETFDQVIRRLLGKK